MAKNLYGSTGGLSNEVTKMYGSIGGLSSNIVKGYCSVNELSKLFFEKSKPLGVTVTTRIYDAYQQVGGVTVTTSIRNYTP